MNHNLQAILAYDNPWLWDAGTLAGWLGSHLPEGLVGIEVKAGRLGRRTIPRSARSFIDAFRPRAFLIVAADAEGSERLGETDVRWIPPWRIAEAVADPGPLSHARGAPPDA